MSRTALKVSSTGQQKTAELPSPLTLRDVINQEMEAKSGASKSTCPQCPNTDAWGTSIFCPKCGWYPKIGKYVPFDQPEQQSRQEEILSVWDAWKAVPGWAWPVIVGNVLIAATDIGIAIAYAKTPTPATIGFFQLTISALMLLPLHLFAYLKSLPDSDEIKPFDIFLKPRLVWKRTFDQLPKTAIQVWLASFSVGGIIFATLFLGGTNVNALLDGMAVKKKPSSCVMGAVTNATGKEEPDMTMEEALTAFTGAAEAAKGTPLGGPDETAKESVVCCVIGFRLSGGVLSTLVVAEKEQGYWVYRGEASCENISPSEQEKFKEAARLLIRRKPAVAAPGDAFWMTPYVMCEVEFSDRTPSGRFLKAKLKQVLLK